MKIFLTMDDLVKATGLSRAYLYPLVMSGEIPSCKFGRARRIPREGLEEWARTRAAAVTPHDES